MHVKVKVKVGVGVHVQRWCEDGEMVLSRQQAQTWGIHGGVTGVRAPNGRSSGGGARVHTRPLQRARHFLLQRRVRVLGFLRSQELRHGLCHRRRCQAMPENELRNALREEGGTFGHEATQRHL